MSKSMSVSRKQGKDLSRGKKAAVSDAWGFPAALASNSQKKKNLNKIISAVTMYQADGKLLILIVSRAKCSARSSLVSPEEVVLNQFHIQVRTRASLQAPFQPHWSHRVLPGH